MNTEQMQKMGKDSMDGRVLQAGPSKQMNWITTTGAGTITPAGNRGTSGDAMNGNAVYYDVNKIITMGGAPAYQDSLCHRQGLRHQHRTGTARSPRSVDDLSAYIRQQRGPASMDRS